eukprot:4121815-Amphidinium_carterae.3
MTEIDADYDVEEQDIGQAKIEDTAADSTLAAASSDGVKTSLTTERASALAADDAGSCVKKEAITIRKVEPTDQDCAITDPARRACILSGRLHLGMEIDDSRMLPQGGPTKEFTIKLGERVGSVRKQATALWETISHFGSLRSLLWHGSWHLEFLPPAQTEQEQKNLCHILWKKGGHDWNAAMSTINRCRRKMLALTDELDPVWQDLKTQVAKNRPRQRKAWDTILKASALPTRAEYEAGEAERLKQLKPEGEARAPPTNTAPEDVRAEAPSSCTVTLAPVLAKEGSIPPPPKRKRSSSSTSESSSSPEPKFRSWSTFTVKDGIEHRAKHKRQGSDPPWITHPSGNKVETEADPAIAPWQRATNLCHQRRRHLAFRTART